MLYRVWKRLGEKEGKAAYRRLMALAVRRIDASAIRTRELSTSLQVLLQIPEEVLMRSQREQTHAVALLDLIPNQVELLLMGEFVNANAGERTLLGFAPQRVRQDLPDFSVQDFLEVCWPFLLDAQDPGKGRERPR